MIEIIVRGKPAPQGSKRHVGNGRMIEMSKAVGPWRERVASETQLVMYSAGLPPVAGAVSVRIWFLMPRPKGHYRTGRNANLLSARAPAHPAGTPDLDKLVRAVLDGLTMGGAWKDDGQVVKLNAEKLYTISGMAACKIEITEVAG